jgi:hypothetical protein
MNKRFGEVFGSLGMCLCLSSATLAQTLLNPGEVLEFTISKDGLTRISIDNDGIEDIFAYPEIYKDNISHHKSGHIFVVADDLEGPVYVTLITKRGVAQDLKLTPKSKKAEPIILRFENSETHQQQLQESTASILGSFVQGMVPRGFYAVDAKEVSRGTRENASLEAIVEKTYQNEKFRVLVFRVKNASREKVTLDNRVLWGSGDVASAFDRLHLDPEESGNLYVIQNRT